MSDRNESVRGLAEEIGRAITEGVHSVLRATGHEGLSDFAIEKSIRASSDHWEARLLAFQSRREAALQAQLHRALGELAGLRGALEQAIEALAWASGAPAFGPDGEAREGWKRLGVPAIDGGNTALSASPLSERAGSVLESVGWLIEHQPENGFFFGPAEQSEHQARQEKLADDWYALRAELQKGGDDA